MVRTVKGRAIPSPCHSERSEESLSLVWVRAASAIVQFVLHSLLRAPATSVPLGRGGSRLVRYRALPDRRAQVPALLLRDVSAHRKVVRSRLTVDITGCLLKRPDNEPRI